MATSLKNLSDHDPSAIPDGSFMKFGIVVSEWNEAITSALLEGAINTLQKYGVKKENILSGPFREVLSYPMVPGWWPNKTLLMR